MSSEFRQEIEFGLENSNRVLASISMMALLDLPASVQVSALSFECLGYYNALEHLMLRFLKREGIVKPSGASSHRDTLRAFESFCTKSNMMLEAELVDAMTELMGFRHVATKIYGFLIDRDRLFALIQTIQSNHIALQKALKNLLDRIEGI